MGSVRGGGMSVGGSRSVVEQDPPGRDMSVVGGRACVWPSVSGLASLPCLKF